MNQNKILFIDIESAPNLGYSWGKWEQNIIEFVSGWYILSFSAKWLDGEHITRGLPDYTSFKQDKQNDRYLVKEMWNLLNQAEIVIAHNGDQFDIKKMNSRFLFHGLGPPSPYRTVDTKKIAKRYFGFNSNKLDEIGRDLSLGRKLHHEGFPLWEACMRGEPKAWKKMLAYNKQDVLLLERVYKKFLPFVVNHPNMGSYIEKGVCPKCTGDLIKRGFRFTNGGKYQAYQCKDCGGWCQNYVNLREHKPFKNV